MLNRVPRGDEIAEASHRLLIKADAYGRWPTPVSDIVAAAGLTEPDHSMFSDFVLAQAPAHLRLAARKLKGKVRALLDRSEREIHIDRAAATAGHAAFLRLHEVGHDLCGWQTSPGQADDDYHLSAATKKTFERQANSCAAELLYQRRAFTAMARDYAISIAAVVELSQITGASVHSTMRRFVEYHDAAVAGIVMDRLPSAADPLAYKRHEVLLSAEWVNRFGDGCWPRVLRAQPYSFITTASDARSSGVPVRSQFTLPDLASRHILLNADVYCNYYRQLALIWVPRREMFRRQRILVSAP